jgi:hypothetical protein
MVMLQDSARGRLHPLPETHKAMRLSDSATPRLHQVTTPQPCNPKGTPNAYAFLYTIFTILYQPIPQPYHPLLNLLLISSLLSLLILSLAKSLQSPHTPGRKTYLTPRLPTGQTLATSIRISNYIQLHPKTEKGNEWRSLPPHFKLRLAGLWNREIRWNGCRRTSASGVVCEDDVAHLK